MSFLFYSSICLSISFPVDDFKHPLPQPPSKHNSYYHLIVILKSFSYRFRFALVVVVVVVLLLLLFSSLFYFVIVVRPLFYSFLISSLILLLYFLQFSIFFVFSLDSFASPRLLSNEFHIKRHLTCFPHSSFLILHLFFD